jgi:TonB family protein
MRLLVPMMRCAAVSLLLIGGACVGQEADPMARIQAAAALNTLDSMDARPWHFKLALTVFDEAGKNPQDGTVEIWHAGADQRSLYTFGTATLTKLLHDGKRYSLSNGGDVPDGATDLVDEVLHPGPPASDIEHSKPELRKQKFGKVELDCIMLTQPSKGSEALPIGLYPTYCMNPTDDQIRSSYNFGSRTVIINRFGKFLDHDVALDLEIVSGQVVVGIAKEQALTTYVPQPEEFLPSAEMAAKQATIARISGGILAGTRLTFVPPVYPRVATQNHESGTVVLRALIGRDGHVRALRPMSVTNSDFVVSAIAAVRHWTYKPYLLNGEPVEVDTTITVNFALNPN